MFRMLGNRVELIRYKITHGDEIENCVSEEHKNEVEQLLTAQGIKFITEPVDQTDNEWFNGLEFDSYDEAMVAIERGEEDYNQPTPEQILQTKVAEQDAIINDLLVSSLEVSDV